MDEPADVPTSTPLDRWLARLARPEGAPGGGAASGVILGIAASLLHMVAEYTRDEPRATESAERLVTWREQALQVSEDDGIASADFGAALALSPDDPDREPRVRAAAIDAADSSARLGAVGIRLLPELRLLTEIGEASLSADLAVAAQALVAGLSGAIINLRANLQTARRHDAEMSALSVREDEAVRLADVRDAVGRIAEQLVPRFEG